MMFTSPLKIAIGVITLWAGGLGNIPPGWHLCDGTNGTPNLRNKFVPSAGPTFAIGSDTGVTAHVHDLTTDIHNHGLIAPPGDLPFGPPSSWTLDANTDTAETGYAYNFPPWYALAYIQFLGD